MNVNLLVDLDPNIYPVAIIIEVDTTSIFSKKVNLITMC